MVMLLRPDEVPAPETLIDYGDGAFGALMFHFAPEGVALAEIAMECGFEIGFLSLENDKDAQDLYERNGDGECILAEWNPGVPDGWLVGGKFDHEDGPFMIYLRKIDPDAMEIVPTVSDVGTA